MSTCASCLYVRHKACPQASVDPDKLACPKYSYKKRSDEELKRALQRPQKASGNGELDAGFIAPATGGEVERPDPEDTQKMVDATVVSEQPGHEAEDAEDAKTKAADDTTVEGSPIELEYFGERAVAAIKALGVTTFEDLAAVPRETIDALPDCGDATIKEIEDALVGLGFRAAKEG